MSWSPELKRADSADGRVEDRLGHPVVDLYLEFLAVRCRPNTVLAAGFDLKVFFTLVRLVDGESGLSARTIQRRLSSVSSLFSCANAPTGCLCRSK